MAARKGTGSLLAAAHADQFGVHAHPGSHGGERGGMEGGSRSGETDGIEKMGDERPKEPQGCLAALAVHPGPLPLLDSSFPFSSGFLTPGTQSLLKEVELWETEGFHWMRVAQEAVLLGLAQPGGMGPGRAPSFSPIGSFKPGMGCVAACLFVEH